MDTPINVATEWFKCANAPLPQQSWFRRTLNKPMVGAATLGMLYGGGGMASKAINSHLNHTPSSYKPGNALGYDTNYTHMHALNSPTIRVAPIGYTHAGMPGFIVSRHETHADKAQAAKNLFFEGKVNGPAEYAKLKLDGMITEGPSGYNPKGF